MSIFRGLYPFEILIMCLGALLFVVMLIALIAYLIRGKSVAGLVVFFVLSVGMLGFPALKAIQYKDGLVSLEFQVLPALERNPEDATARENLGKALKVVEGRPADAEASLTIAKAQWAMGNEQAAVAALRPALSASAPSTTNAAKAVNERIENVQKLEQLTARAEQNPSAVDRTELQRQLNQVTRQQVVSPQTAATVARAHAALGQNEQAAQNAKKALAINPNLVAAPQLKAILQRH
jgi:tetratricopeptide (TPR) repeat protein